MRSVLSILFFLMAIGSGQSYDQVLASGDIAIVGMNADNPDEFAFVALVDLAAGTEIMFVDHGWQSNNTFRTTEDEYTFTAPNTITRGTVIQITNADGSPRFATAGDQLFAFQGTVAAPEFIYALNNEGAGVWQAEASSSNTSALPATLQNGLTAVAVDECDNVAYAGNTTGSKSELLALIGDKSNWMCDDANRLDLGLAFTVTGAANSLPIFTAAFADTTILIDVLFDFTFEATDADDDSLIFSISPNLEAGAVFEKVTGQFTWTPSLAQIGKYQYNVGVSDGTDIPEIHIVINVVSTLGLTAPFFTSSTEPHIFNVGDMVSITFAAEDPQGTDVSIEIVQEPFVCPVAPCTVWDPATNTISWLAGSPDIFSLIVKATDADNEETVVEVIVAHIGELYSGSPTQQDLFNAVAANDPAQTLGYDAARDTMYAVIDLDDDSFVRGIYTGFAVEYFGGDPSTTMLQGGINAEHTWPQSMGAGQEPQRSDLFALFPAKDNVNSSRSNHPYAEIPDNQTTSWFRLAEQLNTIPQTNIDEYSESTGDAFEPRESVKGDVARAGLYFYTVHNGVASADFWALQFQTLLGWADNDPVSPREIVRAHRIRLYQGNMNPYILDPSLLARLWNYVTDIDGPEELPERSHLIGNYPNPFNPRTTISYRLAQSGRVKLAIYNLLGERITTLEDAVKPAGEYETTFNAAGITSGIYFYTLTAGNFTESRKMVLLR